MQSIAILIKALIVYIISFYSLSTKKLDSNININFSAFVGKKVLIVNTAINTADTVQYKKLEQLYQKYKDSLVVIAIPSNNYGNTPMNESEIKTFITTKYNVHYILASKTKVRGKNISPIYSWLTTIASNGMMNSRVGNDFYKYLIDKNGKLIGVFDRTEDPMGANMMNAVEQ